jgi:CubicO group peptidase (beta-lactamase class C family)
MENKSIAVSGRCDPRFVAVREEFERNFSERGDAGASVCVTLDGDVVVDLWGGVADPETGAEWREDTVATVWSCTKGATALVAHMLVARGLIDLDAPVAKHWPEFAQNGKDAIPVRMLLNHQAGLAAVREPVPEGGFYDWDLITTLLARQEPLWEPGARHGYHALTFGHLVGEVARRVTGTSLGQFFAENVAAPLGIDFWIGLPEDVEARVAPNIAHDPPAPGGALPAAVMRSFTEPGSLQALVYQNHGGFLAPGECNTRRFRAAEVPAANGIANARALAGMYRPLALGGAYAGVQLVPEDAIPAMAAVASAGIDAFGLAPTRFSLGFVKCIDNRAQAPGDRESVLLSEGAFGHLGFGGSFGFADPGARMSIGYVTNRQRAMQLLDDRGQALLDAVYGSLDYRLAPSGVWFK